MNQLAPRSTSAGNLTAGQLWILLRAHRRFCFLAGLLSSLALIVFGLFEVPTYTSSATLQFKVNDPGKAMSNSVLSDADMLDIKSLMDRSIDVIRSDAFHSELAQLIKARPGAEELTLAWAVGWRLRLHYATERLGLGPVAHQRVDLRHLSSEEISALLGKMISAQPDYGSRTAILGVTALDPISAERVNTTVVEALIKTNENNKSEEIGKSIDFLMRQRDATRRKLAEANDNLRAFYQENPELLLSNGRTAVVDEAAELRAKKEQLIEDMQANQKLLDFYRQKYQSFSRDSDATIEVFNKFKQELVELKYKRKKFAFQGYDDNNEGMMELDKQIARLEKTLAASGGGGNKNNSLVGVGHDENISEKIMELQDTIKKQGFELDSFEKRLAKATKSDTLSQSVLLLESLKSDVKMSSDLFEDVTKRLEYAQMRRSGGDRQITVMEASSLPFKANGTPLAWRVFFAFIVGVALAISWLVLGVLFSFKIMDWQNVEELGIRFAGVLHDHDADLAEILSNLDCLDATDRPETPVILCTSPNAVVGHTDLRLLSEYLARQGEKTLFIIVGETSLLPSFRLVSDIGFARIYSHPNDREFILQISDRDTLKSIRESIAIVESAYQLRYACVFLYFTRGIEDPNYHAGMKVADQILLLGIPALYSKPEYLRLIQGSGKQAVLSFAFAQRRRTNFRRSAKARRQDDGLGFPAPRPPSFGSRLRNIFFDA